MKTQLYIPKKINVGYQERGGTYTGKLAYIIYWDDKGKLRKETSWQSWRNTSIPNSEIENVPTEGFVLNKGVGGQRESWGWNARNEYIRVYDPRGFEFEISVANLLFILQECTSTKGKGLEGEFVYSWEGKELVLLPVDSFEYKESNKFTSLQGKKVTKADMTPGCTYTCKKGQELIYLGRFPFYFMEYTRNSDYAYELQGKKQHIFLNTKYVDNGDEYSREPKYVPHGGFTKLAVKTSDTPVENYADLLEEFSNSAWGCVPARFKYVSKEIDISNVSGWNGSGTYYYGDEKTVQAFSIHERVKYGGYDYKTGVRGEDKHLGYELNAGDTYMFKGDKLVKQWRSNGKGKPAHLEGLFTKEEILALELFDCELELDNKKTFNIKDY